MTTLANISTTVPINLGKLMELNQLLQDFIEIGYGVQVIATTTNKDGEVFITLRGLDNHIRFYIKDEFSVEGKDAEKYIAKTKEGEVPVWSLGIFMTHMVDNGWLRTGQPAEGDNPKAMDFRLTKYISPTQGVSIFLSNCYGGHPESIGVFTVDLDKPEESADGTQYVGEINYRDVVQEAEERVQKVLAVK